MFNWNNFGIPVAAPVGYQLLKTMQTTMYHIGDNGDEEYGGTPTYTINSTGSQSGTTNVDTCHYAAATIAFVSATKKITDSSALLITVLTGDTIRIRGSASNDGVYTVATGGVAGEIVVTEALVDEAAARYITMQKRTAPSNNTVYDTKTLLTYRRYASNGEKVGVASNGKLVWYDATKCYVLHPAAADLKITSTTKTLTIVGGAGEVARYNVGYVLDLTGFSNAGNNLPGYAIVSVTVNGADLDIVLKTGSTNPLTTEAAGGSRSITLVCQSIFTYVAAMNAASFAGYSDWRIPYDLELAALRDMEVATAAPNATAFPSWPADYVWSSTTYPTNTTYAMHVLFSTGGVNISSKIVVYFGAFLRG
jgi:hypothetical protein